LNEYDGYYLSSNSQSQVYTNLPILQTMNVHKSFWKNNFILNVKRTLLERISRCTRAHIASGIDNITSARLGQCEMFTV
jgi:hypothetical protein